MLPVLGIVLLAPLQFLCWRYLRSPRYQHLVEAETESWNIVQRQFMTLLKNGALLHQFHPRAAGADAMAGQLAQTLAVHSNRSKRAVFYGDDTEWMAEYISTLLVPPVKETISGRKALT